jgi:hypothetical protein
VQRGVFSTEVRHSKKQTLSLQNRLGERATVYIRHNVAPGFTLAESTPAHERLGESHLFRVEIEPFGKAELTIEESTPIYKTADLRSPGDMELVRLYVSAGAIQGPLKQQIADLISLQEDMGNTEQRISTMRDQMTEYRARMDEIHAQIVTLKMVRTGGDLMKDLEKKLQDIGDKLDKATLDLVGLEEKLMIARIHFQDGVADLSLDKDGQDKDGQKKQASSN